MSNRKVWNEDLVTAMECRMNNSLRNNQKDSFLWQKARDAVRAVREDIYICATGAKRIVHLPDNIGKRAKAECEVDMFPYCFDIT